MRSNASNERGLYRNESGGAADDKASPIILVSIPKAGEGRHKAVEPANHAILKKRFSYVDLSSGWRASFSVTTN